MQTSQTPAQSKLYEDDFCLWVADTVAKLKAKNFDALDLDNLIEEIESLAGRDRRELESRLDVLLNHILKRCYILTPENYRGWELIIREQRKALKRLLKQSPSLKNYLSNSFNEVWQLALSDARQDYPQIDFPDEWQFSREVENLLSEEYWRSNSTTQENF
jgi:hypothetical protein